MLNKRGSETATRCHHYPFFRNYRLTLVNLEHCRRQAKALHPRGRFDPSGKSGGAFTFASGSPALVGCKRAL